MGKNKIEIFEDLKKHYVRMALETNKYATTAKAAGVHPNTLRKWMKEYETEILDQMESEGVSVTPESTEKEYKKKYELAMKLLGEKELEVAVLKDALKKRSIFRRFVPYSGLVDLKWFFRQTDSRYIGTQPFHIL